VDVGRSIKYVTADPRWVNKVLIGAVIAFASLLTAIVLVGFVGFFILAGYYQEVTRRAYDNHPEPLPDWDNFGKFLSEGFIVFVGSFLWYLPLLVLEAPLIAWDLVSNDAGAGLALTGVRCLLFPVQVALGLFVLPIVMARYAIDTRFAAMFQFGEIFAEIKRAVVPLLLLAGVSILATFVAFFGIIACCVGIFATIHVATLITSHLRGQVYREARGAGPANAPVAF
jgi:hypothetical protein